MIRHPEYEPGILEGYAYTLSCLKTFEKNGIDLGVHNFTTKEELKKLEEYFHKYFSIGQTTLSMHMRPPEGDYEGRLLHISAGGTEAEDLRWLYEEAVERDGREKPKKKVKKG